MYFDSTFSAPFDKNPLPLHAYQDRYTGIYIHWNHEEKNEIQQNIRVKCLAFIYNQVTLLCNQMIGIKCFKRIWYA